MELLVCSDKEYTKEEAYGTPTVTPSPSPTFVPTSIPTSTPTVAPTATPLPTPVPSVISTPSVTPIVCNPIRLDELVIRTGQAVAPYNGKFLHVKLTSLGKVRDANGQDIYSVWQVRNGSTNQQNLKLTAQGNAFTVALNVPPRSDFFVRSSFARGRATHQLLGQNGHQFDIKHSSNDTFSSEQFVPNVNCQSLPIIGETGNIPSENSCMQHGTWRTVRLRHSFRAPVVIMSTVSYKDEAPVTTRVRNVRSSSFEYQLQEWDYLDGQHRAESIDYLVVEKGRFTTEEGFEIEVGISNITHITSTVTFSKRFAIAPVVLSQVLSYNDCSAVITRHTEVLNSGFKIKLQEEERARTLSHGTEAVGWWIAISVGKTKKMGSIQLQNAVSSVARTVPFAEITLTSPPVLFVQTSTLNESDPGTFR
jgi:hypothetical protein